MSQDDHDSGILDLADHLDVDGKQEGPTVEELVTSAERCEHYFGGSGYSDSLRLRYIKKRYQDDYKELGDLLEGVVGNQVSAITRQNFGPTRRYLSQVVLVRSSEQHGNVLRILKQQIVDHPGKFFIWTDEGDHIHIVHDCAYPGGQCRCRIMQHPEIRGSLQKPLRRIKFVSELDEIDWANVLLYFGVSKWPSQQQIWIGGRLQGLPDYDKVVRWKRMQARSREILEREDQGAGHNYQQGQSNYEDDQQSVSSNDGQHGRQKRSHDEEKPVRGKRTKFERISTAVHALLSKHFCLPANHIKHLKCNDLNFDFLYDPTVEKHYQNACDLFTHIHNKYSLSDFRDLYSKGCPVFYANDIVPWEYYHNPIDSFRFVKELLEFQFENDEEEICKFLINIRDWFNKLGWEGNPKMNTILIEGPANCGKNYFFDMISAIAYNVGHIGRVCNKTNNFPLQDCFNRRLCIANEMSVEETAVEDMKKLCEGTAFNIRVKFQGDKIFTKAPVIVITNNYIDFLHRPEFLGVRVHKIMWRQAELLKESTKKPFPLTLFTLYDHYNISLQ